MLFAILHENHMISCAHTQRYLININGTQSLKQTKRHSLKHLLLFGIFGGAIFQFSQFQENLLKTFSQAFCFTAHLSDSMLH